MTNEEAIKYLTYNGCGKKYDWTACSYPSHLIDLFARGVEQVVLNREDFVGVTSHPTLLPYTNGKIVRVVSSIEVEVFGVKLVYEGK